ncbi:MAG: prolipoprotein diacylglyceryl transferase [Oscillospiraceae bacterium]
MVPIFEIFGKQISAYMIIALAATFLVLFLSYKTAKKRGLDEIKMLFMILWAFVGVLIGGHILYGITNFHAMIKLFGLAFTFSFSSWKELMLGIQLVFGGSVFYGGLIGAIISAGIYSKVGHLTSDYFDIGACMIPLFHTFGRIGCFLSGCCYGIESDIGFVYHYSPDVLANGVRRFPVQLVEAGFNFAIFLIVWYLLRHNKLKGKLLFVYLLLYSVVRFCLEFLRGDAIRGHFWIFSTSQWISIIIFISVVSILLLNIKQTEKNE